MEIRRAKSELREKAEVRTSKDTINRLATRLENIQCRLEATADELRSYFSQPFHRFFCLHFFPLFRPTRGPGWARLGFRILAVAVRQDFRPSDFGLRISCFPVLLASALTLPGDTNSLPDLPSSSLRPPRPEILSGFWEQYGGWVVLAVALLLLIITALIWLLVRPKAPVPIAPGTQAREELEPLRQRAEDGAVLSRVSQIVRRYMTTALALPPAELTTTELSGTLLDNRNIGPKLGAEVVDFLRECDLRKFGPFPPQAPLDAVPRALSLIDRTESRIAELNQLTAAQAAGPAAAQPLPPGQKVSSEA